MSGVLEGKVTVWTQQVLTCGENTLLLPAYRVGEYIKEILGDPAESPSSLLAYGVFVCVCMYTHKKIYLYINLFYLCI